MYPIGKFKRELIFNNNFRIEITNIVTKYIKRNLGILHILTTSQDLEKERLVFYIIRNNLNNKHLNFKNIDTLVAH